MKVIYGFYILYSKVESTHNLLKWSRTLQNVDDLLQCSKARSYSSKKKRIRALIFYFIIYFVNKK